MKSCFPSSPLNEPQIDHNRIFVCDACVAHRFSRSMMASLEPYHPLIIEGMGGYDRRDPAVIGQHIVESLQKHWLKFPPQKPVLLITQGDPYEERGIAAITRQVSDSLSISRALIFLDPDIADYHAPNADRYKVIFEIPYSMMARRLETARAGLVQDISSQVRAKLGEKNAKREAQGKNILPQYYYDFAMLQEVTKIACKQICGGVTIGHTSREINPFSVTSFYQVGLELGFIDTAEMVSIRY
ncbi:shikimate kinase [Alphaproteobacteria bacterium]|nr:shikimate kinase [Alphaproteobacteria bacterium]MDC1241066.1 shikimate kinase [bacterium]